MRRWPDTPRSSRPRRCVVVQGRERVEFAPDAAHGNPGKLGCVRRPRQSADRLPELIWPRDLFRDARIPDRARPDAAVAEAWGADWEYAGLAGS